MSKTIISSLFTLVLFFAVFFISPHPTLAGTVSLGPFDLVLTGDQKTKIKSFKVNTHINYIDTNGKVIRGEDKTYTNNGSRGSDCMVDNVSLTGPGSPLPFLCIKRHDLNWDENASMEIDVTNLQALDNSGQVIKGTFVEAPSKKPLTNPLKITNGSGGTTLVNGVKTPGMAFFLDVNPVSDLTHTLYIGGKLADDGKGQQSTAIDVDPTKPVGFTFVFSKPMYPQEYTLEIFDDDTQNSGQARETIKVIRTTGDIPFIKKMAPLFVSDTNITSGPVVYTLNATLNMSRFKPGSTNSIRVKWSSGGDILKGSFHITDNSLSNFEITLDPETYDSKEDTYTKPLKVKFDCNSFTPGRYKAEIQNTSLSAENIMGKCSDTIEILLDKDLQNGTTYTVRVTEVGSTKNPQPKAHKNFSIKGSYNAPVSGGLTVTPPAQCTGKNCTSATGSSCNVNNGHAIEVTGQTRDKYNNITGITFKDLETKTKGELPLNQVGVDTSIGCIPTQPSTLVKSLVRFTTGIGGGISLLLMIYGAMLWITSGGNPDNMKKAQDQFTNAAIGLLFIIFSIMILKIIGVDILQIPGFTK